MLPYFLSRSHITLEQRALRDADASACTRAGSRHPLSELTHNSRIFLNFAVVKKWQNLVYWLPVPALLNTKWRNRSENTHFWIAIIKTQTAEINGVKHCAMNAEFSPLLGDSIAPVQNTGGLKPSKLLINTINHKLRKFANSFAAYLNSKASEESLECMIF